MTEDTQQSFVRIEKGLKPELVGAAEFFGVTLPEDGKIGGIRAAFVAEGIDDTQYKVYTDALEAARVAEEERIAAEALAAEEAKNNPEPVVVVTTQVEPDPVVSDTILLKMNRRNPSMVIRGYKFTKEDPYAVVPTKIAEFIVMNYHGFSQPLPSEVESYYDGVLEKSSRRR